MNMPQGMILSMRRVRFSQVDTLRALYQTFLSKKQVHCNPVGITVDL
jgi:hypothetical protein